MPVRARGPNNRAMSEAADKPRSTPPFAAMALIAVIFINMLGFGIIVPLLPFYAKSFDGTCFHRITRFAFCI